MLQAPFPWFGGKSRVAEDVWQAFGNVPNYVEPFFGSGAVLLGRPHEPGIETINDKDGYVANFWRAVQHDPAAVASFADWPVNENDLHARHSWLRAQKDSFVPRLEGDPDFYDAKIAGWWVWGLACWIGGGFCGDSGSGPWQVVDGQLVHLGDAGQGVARRRVHLGNAGKGVSRQLVHLGSVGQGVSRRKILLVEWFEGLANRLKRVRVCCGDWARVCGPSPTIKHGLTGVFLDPPYGDNAGREMNIYAEECGAVAEDVRKWAIANGDNPLLRIALCGYEGEHDMPQNWRCHAWKTRGGYGSQSNDNGRENSNRERVWFSPHCIAVKQMALF